MERICPLLALAGDHRSVGTGPDPRHRCHALEPPATLELVEQATRCLTEAHLRCELLLDYRRARARPAMVPAPAPDATFVSTRLVVDPGLRGRPGRTRRPSLRRSAVFLAAGATVATVAALGAGATGALSNLRFPPIQPLSTALPTAAPTPLVDAGSPTPAAPTPSPSAVPETPPPATPTPAASAPEPTPGDEESRTYVVQEGDTLYEIAVQFGSTVEAIMAANGLTDPDVISAGRTLIIP